MAEVRLSLPERLELQRLTAARRHRPDRISPLTWAALQSASLEKICPRELKALHEALGRRVRGVGGLNK